MFSGCSSLIDLSSLSLPNTVLAESCYSYMFKGCTSLTTPPLLSARTLAPHCYESMFEDCISL